MTYQTICQIVPKRLISIWNISFFEDGYLIVIKLGNKNTPQLYKKNSPNKKNEIEIKQQILIIIPQLKKWGTPEIVNKLEREIS